MDEYLPVFRECTLFAGMNESDISSMLKCLGARASSFEKNSFVFMAGDPAASMGVVLSGGVHVVQEDFWGNRSIVTHVPRGGIFGEAFACAEETVYPVSAVASERSTVMRVDCGRIIKTCTTACGFHSRLIRNLLTTIAGKNVMLTQHLEHVTRHGTREKLMAYLSSQARAAGSGSFVIPFNRQELADYISADRSAMSNELCKMRDEGILRFRKNHFELL
ncbi:MAG: Crp/Fnr family transcriptional regulator [Synergistaceae bacterium]|jgi:CRP-like cAMP-binding protein|nr:Crp/Fnr family transcriptional regulator [Synergistaceae bacterium]